MDWYERRPTDYKEDTWHLTLAEHGAYNLLLDHYYSTERPLPDNDRALASLCNCSVDEWLEVKPAVVAFFKAKNGKLRSKKCESILELAFSKRKDGAERVAKYRKHKKPVTRASNQQVTTSKERKKVRREEEVSTAPIAAGDFDSFWALYPRKLEKKAARKAYQTALKTTSPEDLLSGLTNYCEEIKRNGTETRFIKHCTTWLNQGCWEDDHTEIVHAGGNNKAGRGFAEIAADTLARMERGEHGH